MHQLKWYPILTVLFLLSACQALGITRPPPPQTLSQTLVYAQSTATTANLLAAKMLARNIITADQGRDVGEASDVVVACIKRARSHLIVGDAVSAQAQIAVLAQDLEFLSTFIGKYEDKHGGKR